MMKITALLGFFCLMLLFSCSKDNLAPVTVPVKSTATSADTTVTGTTGTTPTPTSGSPAAPTTPTSGSPAATTTPTSGSPAATTTPATGGTATTTTPATVTTTPATGNTSTPTTKPTTTTPAATGSTGTTTTTTTKPTTGTATAPATTKPATGTTTPAPAKPVTSTPTPPPATTTTTTTTVTTTPPSPTGDDTRTLQQLLNAGNVTLVTGKTYNITGLWVPHAFNLNGASVKMTSTSGTAIVLSAIGASISNGNLTGTWSNSTPGNPNGVSGIQIQTSGVSVSHVNIASFSACGIASGPYSNVSITNCNITNTGYLGFYFDAETALTSGGVFSNNVVDRSMIPASSILESAVAIRGSTAISNITTSNWTISGNTFKMPVLPASMDAECMEVRNMLNSTISNNTFIAGSIGCSVVRSSNIAVSSNKLSGSTEEAIEFADCNTSSAQNNTITSSRNVGELIDGSVGCNGITITNDVVSGTTQECIHAYLNTKNVTITGCTLTAASGAMAINLQATNNVKVVNTIFNGNGVATEAVMLDTCPGNLTITGGSISNFKSCVIAIYDVKPGLTTNNVTMSGVTVTSVAYPLSTYLQNGAAVGSNIVVVNH